MLHGRKGRAKSFITVITTWAHLLFHSAGGEEKKKRGRGEIKLAHRGVYRTLGDSLSCFFPQISTHSRRTHTHINTLTETNTHNTHCRGPLISQSDAVCVGKWNELWKARLSVFITVFIFPPCSESCCPSPPRCAHYTSKAEQCLTTR